MSLKEKSSELFGPEILVNVGLGRRIVELEPEQSFFVQGSAADSVFCLKEGRARVTVVSSNGKQATIAILSPGDLFGEESLARDPGRRKATVTAVTTCTALKIKKGEMIEVMNRVPALTEYVLSFLLARKQRIQDDFVDQLLNSSEKRLARTLLLLAEIGKPGDPQTLIPPITQETLAEMVGTTRSRVSFFMNRFRDLGLIKYKGRIQVHKPRLQAAMLGQLPEYGSVAPPIECTL